MHLPRYAHAEVTAHITYTDVCTYRNPETHTDAGTLMYIHRPRYTCGCRYTHHTCTNVCTCIGSDMHPEIAAHITHTDAYTHKDTHTDVGTHTGVYPYRLRHSLGCRNKHHTERTQ